MNQEQKPSLFTFYSGEENELCLSPFVWRIKMALKHKNVDFDEVKLTLKDINAKVLEVTDGKWKKVPAMKFQDDVLFDSRDIAMGLEAKYPGNDLFPNGTSTARFLESYVMTHSLTSFVGLVMPTEFLSFKKEDREFGKNMGSHFNVGDHSISVRYSKVAEFLNPIALMLKESPFLEGDKVTYSDYIIFALLQWFRIVVPLHFKHCIENAEDKTILKWFESILDLHDGYARSFPINTKYGEFAHKL